MYRRTIPVLALVLVIALAACTNKRVKNPLADVGSKQPDKVLFDRAMDAMKHNKFDVARMTLQTLINTYPDSEYIARAKLAVGDSWYAEGGSAALAQAEAEYKDFITFFPNMPEAAEAQLKVADIHYRQMEKPDRDFTHAKRAEDEYRQLILQYPDSKLVEQAKQRLLEVQEVLAEREFRIGRFYFLRESWAAAIARLQSLVDTYPLFSGADEALYMLGQAYERQVEHIRAAAVSEAVKGKLIRKYNDEAAKAYSKILTRYPVMARAGDAKARLQALKYPVPQATAEMIEQNKREEAGRNEPGMFGKFWSNFHKHPDISAAAKVGEPTLVDPKPLSAPEVLRAATAAIMEASAAPTEKAGGSHSVSVETVKTGEPPPNQPVPRSQPAAAEENNTGIPELKPLPDAGSAGDGSSGSQPAASPAEQPAPPQPPEPVPPQPAASPAPPATEQPAAATPPTNQPTAQEPQAPKPAPAQVNEAQSSSEQKQADSGSQSSSDKDSSSSSRSKKKKKGIRKLF